MAPRKTTKTAVEPTDLPDTRNPSETMGAAIAAREPPVLDLAALGVEQFEREQRFQVALAVWPKIVTELVVEKLEDENDAGASARIAFEYADAFIAQSKKGQGDGE